MAAPATGRPQESVVSRLGALLRDGDRVLVTTGAGEPAVLIDAVLAASAERRLRLELVQVMTGAPGRVAAAAADHRVVAPVPGHATKGHDVAVLPTSMRQWERAITTGMSPVDGVLMSGSTAPAGLLSPGICVDVVPAAFHRARFRAAELNAALPAICAEPLLPLDSCDLTVHTDRPPPTLSAALPDERAHAIGGYVAELVADGAVLELGVGRALAGVPGALAHAGVRVAVHSGLLSDWTATLADAGVASLPLGCAGGQELVGSVAMGSAGFYRWLDGNRAVRLVESAHAHDPAHLATLGQFVAVNASSAVDVHGQAGLRQGATAQLAVGGLLDFAIAGAYGGRSVIAVESTDAAGRSRIVPGLGAVQLPGSLVTHVVTEYGVAVLENRTWHQRAKAIIAVAHPDHRAALRRAVESV